MKPSWIVRIANRILPRSWRSSVAADLDEEAAVNRRGEVWRVWHATAISARLRPAMFADAFAADIRSAIRGLTRAKTFTAAAVATFALGIGANIAVLSIIDRMIFRPLPYAEPERLVQIHAMRFPGATPSAGLTRDITVAVAEHSESFSGIAYASNRETETPGPDGQPLRLATATVNVLDVLAIRPAAGRGFVETDVARRGYVILLSHETWQQRFGGAPDLVGMRWTAGRVNAEIVGVLPPGFVLPTSQLGPRFDGILASRDLKPGPLDNTEFTAAPVARLKPGVSLDAARAEVSVIAARIRPDDERRLSQLEVQPLQAGMFMFFAPHLRLIALAGVLVLLVACANLSGLLLARGRSREREAGIRQALGATRGRLVRMVLVEAALLCSASGAVALALCFWIQRAALLVVPEIFRGFAVPVFDGRIVAATLGAAFVCAVVAGILPALQSRQARLALAIQSARPGAGPGRLVGGTLLLVAEAAVAMVLVSGAAVTVRNLGGLLFKDRGFVVEDLFVLNVGHAPPRTNRTGDRRPWYDGDRLPRVRGILDALRGTPQVVAGGVVSQIPIDNWGAPDEFWKTQGLRGASWGISEGVFEAMETPMVAGRPFRAEDIDAGAQVALLNRVGAHALWPSDELGEVVGRNVEVGSTRYTVVGVVGDIRRYPGVAPTPSLFLPITSPDARVFGSSALTVFRTSPGAVLDGTALGARLDERFPPASVRVPEPVSDMLAPWMERPRFQAALFASFGVIALVLAAVGLYAVAAFDVARRRYEMGVRLTLGATGRDLRRLVIRAAVSPVLIGSAIGLLVTWWAAQFLQAFLFEVDARDPWTYGLVALTLVATAVLAAWLPARRAARTDPAMVLRSL